MAKLKNKMRVFIDGHEIKHVQNVEMERQLPEQLLCVDARFVPSKNLITIKIQTPELTIECRPEYYEVAEDKDEYDINIYGPLKKAIPTLFKLEELYPWQVAYIKRLPEYIAGKEQKYRRNDTIFTTDEAKWFKKGYEAK